MPTYYSNPTIKYRVYKNLIIFLVVANNKTINESTSRACHFCQLELLKSLDYCYYLLTIYTSL